MRLRHRQHASKNPQFISVTSEIISRDRPTAAGRGFSEHIEQRWFPLKSPPLRSKSISVLHELRSIEITIAQNARAECVPNSAKSLHTVTPDRPIISNGKARHLGIAKGLEALALDADQVGFADQRNVEPRVSASGTAALLSLCAVRTGPKSG
jgi:hypothetical protein